MKRWYLGAVFLVACGCEGQGSAPAPPATSSTAVSVTAFTIAPPLQVDGSSAKRKLTIELVRRTSGDLTMGRAGDRLSADERARLTAEAKGDCAKGYLPACTLHGALVDLAGEQAPLAAASFVQACKGGDMLACARLALDWPCFHPESNIRKKLVCPDDLKAQLVAQSAGDKAAPAAGLEGSRALGQKACDALEPVGCVAVASSLEEAAEDRKHAFPLYERACEMGDYLGCERAVRIARQSIEDDKTAQVTRRKDAERALPMLLPGCDAGDGRVCAELASYFEGSWGAPADMPRAKGFHQKACAGGVRESCERAKLFK